MHTPGPWKAVNLQETTKGITHKFAWVIEHTQFGVVTHVARLALVDGGPEVVSSNAHILAASLEMLEALKSQEEFWEMREHELGGLSPEAAEVRAQIQAAIANAEGRS